MHKYVMNDIMKTLEDKKEEITEELSKQYSLNKISLEEYERLIEYAHKIETEKELIILEKIVNENNVTTVYKDISKEKINNARAKNEYTILSSKKTHQYILFLIPLGRNYERILHGIKSRIYKKSVFPGNCFLDHKFFKRLLPD
jgi:hypothetical protein